MTLILATDVHAGDTLCTRDGAPYASVVAARRQGDAMVYTTRSVAHGPLISERVGLAILVPVA